MNVPGDHAGSDAEIIYVKMGTRKIDNGQWSLDLSLTQMLLINFTDKNVLSASAWASKWTKVR